MQHPGSSRKSNDAIRSRRQAVVELSVGVFTTFAARATAASDGTSGPAVQRVWGRRGKGVGVIEGCISIALGEGDTIFVTNFHNRRIQRFTPEGHFITAFPVPPNPTGPGTLRQPLPGAVEQQFSADGRFLRGFGGKGSDPARFHLPHGLTLDSRGHPCVVDTLNARIQCFDVR